MIDIDLYESNRAAFIILERILGKERSYTQITQSNLDDAINKMNYLS